MPLGMRQATQTLGLGLTGFDTQFFSTTQKIEHALITSAGVNIQMLDALGRMTQTRRDSVKTI
jgi:hypothetical protein